MHEGRVRDVSVRLLGCVSVCLRMCDFDPKLNLLRQIILLTDVTELIYSL